VLRSVSSRSSGKGVAAADPERERKLSSLRPREAGAREQPGRDHERASARSDPPAFPSRRSTGRSPRSSSRRRRARPAPLRRHRSPHPLRVPPLDGVSRGRSRAPSSEVQGGRPPRGRSLRVRPSTAPRSTVWPSLTSIEERCRVQRGEAEAVVHRPRCPVDPEVAARRTTPRSPRHRRAGDDREVRTRVGLGVDLRVPVHVGPLVGEGRHDLGVAQREEGLGEEEPPAEREARATSSSAFLLRRSRLITR